MLNSRTFFRIRARQQGASAVEFGIIAVIFFTLFFGIVELGRYFYLYNTVQEVTRCAARKAVVQWSTDWAGIKRECVFQPGSAGTVALPAGWEITNETVSLRFLHALPDTPPTSPVPGSAVENMGVCLNPEATNCIRYVEAKLWCDKNSDYCQSHMVKYQPFSPFVWIPLVPSLPNSTVFMPVESLGYRE